MKILLTAQDFSRNSSRLTLYEDITNEFIKQGHSVTIINPDPSLSSPMIVEAYDNLKICRFKSGKIKNVNRAIRAINETMLSHRAWSSLSEILKNDKHDLILYQSPSIFWGSFVKRLKKVWNVPSILIIRDIFPQWVIDIGLIRSYSPIAYYFKHYEKITYSAADIIAVQSPNNKTWMLEHNITKPIDILYNWINTDPINTTVFSS